MKESKVKGLLAPQILPRVAFGIYALMCLLAVPVVNHDRDLVIFSSWGLFDFNVRQEVGDFTWDKGETYLLRDNISAAQKSGLNVGRIFKSALSGELQKISKHDRETIKYFCGCEEVEFQVLKGSLYEHIIAKESLKILLREQF
jgi:hypothetical protein